MRLEQVKWWYRTWDGWESVPVGERAQRDAAMEGVPWFNADGDDAFYGQRALPARKSRPKRPVRRGGAFLTTGVFIHVE